MGANFNEIQQRKANKVNEEQARQRKEKRQHTLSHTPTHTLSHTRQDVNSEILKRHWQPNKDSASAQSLEHETLTGTRNQR